MYKIISITFKEHIKPNMSCGTGYSEPDEFIVEIEGIERTYSLYVDIWYKPTDKIKEEFIKSVKHDFYRLGDCENIDEAFEMYVTTMKENKHFANVNLLKL